MVAHGIGNNISFRHIENVGFPKETCANVETEVERLAVEAHVVVTKFCTLVGVEDLLVDHVGGRQDGLAWELGKFTRVVPFVMDTFNQYEYHVCILHNT